jgi:hypothetical protein
MHTLRTFHRTSKFIALLSLLPAIWLLMQGYHGLTGDAQLYAFQALARINPPLATDLYLQNTSQDQFTVFSPLYAFFIRWFGIEGSARLLTVAFTIWLLIAALSLARALIEKDTALLAVAFLMIVPSDYGAAGVFHFFEGFLTARLPAEALVITAIACHFRGRPRLAVAIGGVALLVHPLMALPGFFLLISFWVSTRVSVMVTVVGVLLLFGIATAAGYLSAMSHLFVVMDDAWLAVVRERSQFLFLQTWTPQDWDLNMRPVLYAAMIAVVSQDDRVRNLCMNAALIGVAGLAAAFIADFSAPLAYLVQGQSWRWIWVVGFVGILLLPSTAMSIWADEKCGPFCSILLVCGWTLTDSAAPVALCLTIWLSRPYLGRRASLVVRLMAGIASVAILGWFVSKSVPILASHAPPAEQLRRIFALKLPALLLLIGFWRLVRSDRILCGPALAGVLAVVAAAAAAPSSLQQRRVLSSPAEVNEFSAWIDAIPPTSTVLVTPPRDVGGFVWFTLGRPNYLSVDQSAGVVFSRVTALEVERRSQILMPLMTPNWMIRTRLRENAAAHASSSATRPLTPESLSSVCRDPALGFVISPQNVGFDPITHRTDGIWKGWNLYDCRLVRSSSKNVAWDWSL